MPTPCYFCGQPLAAGEEIERHHPDRDQFPNWTEPAHAECHARYHSEAGHFTKWGGWSAYKGRPGYERTIARWPGWHRMGGLARARSATRDERGRFE